MYDDPTAFTRRQLIRVASASAGLLGASNLIGVARASSLARWSDRNHSALETAGGIGVSAGTGDIAVASGYSFGNLDPHTAVFAGDIALNTYFLFEALYGPSDWSTLDERGDYVPELAEGLPEQIDPLTYRCTIREGAMFHDESPVLADDVVFSIERITNPETLSIFAEFFEPIAAVAAIDDRVVEFTLSSPVPYLVDRLSVAKVMPRHFAEDTDDSAIALAPIGSGPYRVVEAVSAEQVQMEAFTGYNGRRSPTLATVGLRVITDGNARTSALRSAEVAAIDDVPYPTIASIERDAALAVGSAQSASASNFLFHCGKPPFNDKRVRQAVLYAIDREAIRESVFFGSAIDAVSVLPPEHPFYREPAQVYTYDPDRARSLLAEAGVRDGIDAELLISDDDWIRPQGEIIQQNLGDVGMSVELVPGRTDGLFGRVVDGNYDFFLTTGDLSMFSWEADILLGLIYRRAPAGQFVFWENETAERVDELLVEAAESESEDRRTEIFGELQDLIADEIPNYPLQRRELPAAWQRSLSGFRPLPTPGVELSGVTLAS